MSLQQLESKLHERSDRKLIQEIEVAFSGARQKVNSMNCWNENPANEQMMLRKVSKEEPEKLRTVGCIDALEIIKSTLFDKMRDTRRKKEVEQFLEELSDMQEKIDELSGRVEERGQ